MLESNVEKMQSQAHIFQEVSLTGPAHPELSLAPFSCLLMLLLCFQQDHSHFINLDVMLEDHLGKKKKEDHLGSREFFLGESLELS